MASSARTESRICVLYGQTGYTWSNTSLITSGSVQARLRHSESSADRVGHGTDCGTHRVWWNGARATVTLGGPGRESLSALSQKFPHFFCLDASFVGHCADGDVARQKVFQAHALLAELVGQFLQQGSSSVFKMHRYECTHTHTHTHTLSLSCNKHIHTHTDMDVRTHTHIHTLAHTHTHTFSLIQQTHTPTHF